MRNLLLGSAVGMAGLLTISCSDEAAGPLGPVFDPAAAPAFTGEMRIVLPEPGTRIHATSSFLLAIEQQVQHEAGPAYGVIEVATDRTDWQAIREFAWSAQSTDFSFEVAPDVPVGLFRLRVVVRDAQDRSLRLASAEVDLVGTALSAQEAALDGPRPPRRVHWSALLEDDAGGDAHYKRPEAIAPDRAADIIRLRPEYPMEDDPRGRAVPVLAEALAP